MEFYKLSPAKGDIIIVQGEDVDEATIAKIRQQVHKVSDEKTPVFGVGPDEYIYVLSLKPGDVLAINAPVTSSLKDRIEKKLEEYLGFKVPVLAETSDITSEVTTFLSSPAAVVSSEAK